MRVAEIDGHDDVELRVPNTNYCLGSGDGVGANHPIVLQNCVDGGSPAQSDDTSQLERDRLRHPLQT